MAEASGSHSPDQRRRILEQLDDGVEEAGALGTVDHAVIA
jgi:hypothetical protein